MGSSNLQCAISKETISTGDKTVTFLLEPVLSGDGNIKGILKPASNQGEYFKVNSLPILGEYDDYGNSFADDNQDKIISLVKDFYGFDYSEELSNEWGSRGWRIKRGKPVDSPYDTNTAEFVVLRAVYDVIINNTDKSSITGLLKNNQIELAFGSAIDNQLLTSIDGMGSDSSVINAALFLKGIRNIGASLTPAPTISSQMEIQDFKMSQDTRNNMGEAPSIKNDPNTRPSDFCLLTRKAVNNHDIVYLLPIMSTKECGKPIDLISFDNYSVTARYKPISKPMKCVFNNGTYSLSNSTDEVMLENLANMLSVPITGSTNALLYKITTHSPITVGRGMFASNYQVSYIVLSEHAFNYLNNSENSTKCSYIKPDANTFLNSSTKLYSISKDEHSSFKSFKESIEKSGVFDKKTLDFAISTIDIYADQLDVNESNLSYLVKLILKYIKPKADEETARSRHYNAFFEQILNIESDNSEWHRDILFEHSDKLDDIFDNNHNTDDFHKALKSLIDDSLFMSEEIMPIISSLDRAAITLMPFDKYTGEISISEQHKIIDAIDVASYEHIKYHIDKDENDYDY